MSASHAGMITRTVFMIIRPPSMIVQRICMSGCAMSMSIRRFPQQTKTRNVGYERHRNGFERADTVLERLPRRYERLKVLFARLNRLLERLDMFFARKNRLFAR